MDGRSFFEKLLGEPMGQIVGFYFGFLFIIFMFMGLMYLLWGFMDNGDHKDDVLSSLPPDTQQVVLQIADTQKQTQALLSQLDSQIKDSEKTLEDKKQTLDELQKQHELLKLTPEQMQLVADYNKSVGQVNSLKEWLAKRDVWYDLTAAFIISAFFFGLGIYVGRRTINATSDTM